VGDEGGREGCTFCQIIDGGLEADVVLEEPHAVSFLEHRPLFPGHVLVTPRNHVRTLPEVPGELMGPLFETVQRVARGAGGAGDVRIDQ
jgi:histidine triad (HIT) family protein